MRSLGHRIEAIVWLGRPASMFGKVPPVLSGYLLGSPSWQIEDLCLVLVFALSMQLIISSLNDVYDAPRDRLTAPYLPIPAGLISRGEACIAPVAAGVVLAVVLWMLSVETGVVVLIVLTACVGVAIGGIYGKTKSRAWSPLLASTGSMGAVLWGWLLSEQKQIYLMLTALMVMLLHGVFMNLINQMRDSGKDPAAGNITIAARRGWRVTLFLAGAVRVLECGAIVAIAIAIHAPLRAVLVIGPLVALAWGIRNTKALTAAYRASRLASTTILAPLRLSTFLAEIALLTTVSPAVGILVGGVMWLWYRTIRPAYERQIVDGALARTATDNA